ncbi:MAG: hypothetical protein OEW58_01070 [Gammaproteobacteria bacterium]|nr:hypothetical protein [Gammaproteobacteria bacterium]
MKSKGYFFPQLVVTEEAAKKLLQLKSELKHPLSFLLERQKDSKTYFSVVPSQWVSGFCVEVNGVAIALAKSLLSEYMSLHIGFMRDSQDDEKGSFILSENDLIVATLPLDNLSGHLYHEAAEWENDDDWENYAGIA